MSLYSFWWHFEGFPSVSDYLGVYRGTQNNSKANNLGIWNTLHFRYRNKTIGTLNITTEHTCKKSLISLTIIMLNKTLKTVLIMLPFPKDFEMVAQIECELTEPYPYFLFLKKTLSGSS